MFLIDRKKTTSPSHTLSQKVPVRAGFMMLFAAFLTLALILPLPLAAASPTPTASAKVTASPKTTPTASAIPKTATTSSTLPIASPPTPSTTSSETTENLKDRIDRVLEQRREKLKELEASGERRRIFVGEVQRVTEQTLTVKTVRGNESFTVGTEIPILRDGKKATIDDIAVGDWIGTIGYQDKETIQPQRIFVSSKSYAAPEYRVTLANVVSSTRTQLVVTESSGQKSTYTLATSTLFQSRTGQTIKREALGADMQVAILTKVSDPQAATLVRSLAGQ